MDVLHANCAGLCVYNKTVIATVIISQERSKQLKATQSFGTCTGYFSIHRSLLRDWSRFHHGLGIFWPQ